MPTLRTRSAKGSELSHAELDANFKRTVSAKTTTYACLVSDNRSVIECNHATTAFTVTLGDASTMAAAETGDYEVTIANIGAATVTVARAGTDTIDGGATSITLPQYSAVTLKVNNAGNGYNSIARGVGNNTIWHSGNDGTGSGLDADTLDGNEYTAIFDNIYPVGSIHLSTSATNPGTSLGRGTWTQIAAGRTLIGEGTSDQAFTAAATGGASTHTLTTDEIPAHTHSGVVATPGSNTIDVVAGSATTGNGQGQSTGSTGGGSAHNNLPPYLVVYIWERTA